MAGVLLVAATERELCGHDGLVCGIGPVEAAVTTARALARSAPEAVVHLGIAGARGLEPATLVVGTESVYCDLRAPIRLIDRLAPDGALVAAAREALPGALALAIGTSAAVGGTDTDVPVEAMEGFGVLRACADAGIPGVEVRAVSNEIGEADRARWSIEEALEALARAIPALVAAAAT